jgi:hypothetical protein
VRSVGKGGTSVLVAGIITLGACGGSHRATDPPHAAPGVGTTPTPTSAPHTSTGAHPRSRAVPAPATAPTTPKPVPSFSFDGSVPPPELVNTGTDYVTIVKSLERYGNWLGAHHPDPALVPVTVAPGTQLLATYVNGLVALRDNKERIIEKLNGPTTVTILSATPDAFSARVVEHISVHQTFDRTGHLTSERRFVGPTTYLNVVVLAHGHWYFAASAEQHPAVVHL